RTRCCSSGGRAAGFLGSTALSAAAAAEPGVRLKECAMFGKLAGVLFVVLVCCDLVAAEEFGAMITKVDGDNVTFYKTWFKRGEKPRKGKATTLTARNARVYQARVQFNKKKRKVEIVPGAAIEGGLKNDVFKLVGKASIAARITTSDNNTSITRILSLKAGVKKKPLDVESDVRAEKANTSPEQLRKTATQVVTGQVTAVPTRTE